LAWPQCHTFAAFRMTPQRASSSSARYTMFDNVLWLAATVLFIIALAIIAVVA
jgi:hypothetical protein